MSDKKMQLYCFVCGVKTKLVYKSNYNENSKTYCSTEHKKLGPKRDCSGENNPNYGKKWSKEAREKQSIIVKSKVDDAYRLNCSKSNKGKKFSAERCENISRGHKGINPWKNRADIETTKKKIGEKSSAKWTTEYKIENRKRMEALGYWVPLSEKSDRQIYFKESNWNCSHIDKFMQHKLFKEIGIFNNKTNTKGLVRDHSFSRHEGFTIGVFPVIVRHPCNVNIILHGENSSKRKKSIISIEKLISDIENYTGEWFEQELCMKAISEFKNGKRWNRKEASDDLLHI